MREEKLTVSGLYGPGWPAFAEERPLPLLQLAGRWLWEAGFGVGTRVRVEVVAEGRLELTRVDREASTAQGHLPLVWIPAEQIGEGEETRWTVREEAADS